MEEKYYIDDALKTIETLIEKLSKGYLFATGCTKPLRMFLSNCSFGVISNTIKRINPIHLQM
jgi:hypothetical protein